MVNEFWKGEKILKVLAFLHMVIFIRMSKEKRNMRIVPWLFVLLFLLLHVIFSFIESNRP